MRRTERFNHRNNEAASLNEKAKKGIAAVALATTGLFAAGCSGGEGGSSIGGVLSVGGSNEVLTSEECENVEGIWSLGTTGADPSIHHTEKYTGFEMLADNLALPDGSGRLAAGSSRGFLIDPITLSDKHKKQLIDGSNDNAERVAKLSSRADVQSSTVIVYGEPDSDVIKEYMAGNGWPESMSDGVLDDGDFNLCVTSVNPDIAPEQWITEDSVK